VLPVAFFARRASQSTSRAPRSPSAVAVPCAFSATSRLGPLKRPRPSTRMSPPSSFACTPASEKPVSVKLTVPLACVNDGAAGTTCSSLSASATLACTLALSMASSGSSRCSL